MKPTFALLLVGFVLWCTPVTAQPIPDFSSPDQPTTVVEEPEPEPEVEKPIVEEVAVSTIDPKPSAEPEPEKTDDAEPEADPKTQIGKCRLAKIQYLESGSRKLQRAMRSKGYKLKSVGLETKFNIDSKRFQTFSPNHQATVVGVLSDEKDHPRGYIVANTTKGRLVVSMTWSGCRPKATAIVYPKADNPSVDLEPFKYWGFRVLWNVPRSLGKKDLTTVMSMVTKK